MSNEESGQSRPGQQGGPASQWGSSQAGSSQAGSSGAPGQGGQSGTPGQRGQSGPSTNPWPTSGGAAPFGDQSGAGQFGGGPSGGGPSGGGPSGAGQQGPGQQGGPGQAPTRPQGQGERPGWGQQPAYTQGPHAGPGAQTGPQQVQSGQPGPSGQPGSSGQPGPSGQPSNPGAQSVNAGGTTPAAPSGTDNGTLVRIALHVLALLLVVLGISVPMDDMGTLWGDSAAWAAFAVVAALAQGAAFFGKPAIGGNGWLIGAAGAAGLLLFWTLLMLPMIQTNMAFMVTVGTACAGVAVALSPDRRL